MIALNPYFFYFFAGLAIACALFVVLKKNPVASAFSLVVVFFSFAAIYAMLEAHLIAALQILVYAGAIMVLFIFVIMLLNQDGPSLDLNRSPLYARILGGAACLGIFASFLFAFKNATLITATGLFTPERIEAAGGNTQVISELMFSEYILPFELTSVLLLAAIVASVAVAKRKRMESEP
ncbi:MAG: NADH-quinone oxidoreductase subunit J [Bdellovibrionota bacterium]